MEKEKQSHTLKRSANEVVAKNKSFHKKIRNHSNPSKSSVSNAKSAATLAGGIKLDGVRSAFMSKSKYDFTVKDATINNGNKDSSNSFEFTKGAKSFNLQKFNKHRTTTIDSELSIEESFEVLKPALLILIKRTSNNIFFSVSHRNGLPLYQTSGGSTGISGSKRDTPASAETAAKLFFNQVLQRGYHRCYLRIDGMFDNTTRAAVRGLQSSGLINFSKIQHSKVVTHNGVRLPKVRRT